MSLPRDKIISNRDCRCSECGREMSKAKKVHRGNRFCETCYARMFKRNICPGCQNFARLPIFDPEAVCRMCEVRLPCIRCNRSGLKVGKLTVAGPVCASCAPHFRTPSPCERCSKPSTALVRTEVERTILRCCPTCRSAIRTSTCSACRRARVIVTQTGPALCKKCYELGEVACPICSREMPAGRGNACEECEWKASFERRLKSLPGAAASDQTKQDFEDFAHWLSAHRGAHYAALNMKRYLSFFEEVGALWPEFPSYENLVDHFGAERLRRVRTVIRWLNESSRIAIDATVRERVSDRRRINRSLTFFSSGTGHEALVGYSAELEQRLADGLLQIRSVRLAISSAVQLLYVANPHGHKLPSQESLRRLLLRRPGLYASLQGFVGYLNRRYGVNLRGRFDPHWLKKASRNVGERRLMGLYAHAEDSEKFDRRWIREALRFFHGVRRIRAREIDYRPEPNGTQPGFNVTINNQEFWVPSIR